MAGFRASFINGLQGVASAIPLPFLRFMTGQRIVMPVYHLVSDLPVPHVNPLYSIKNTRDFIADLDFLLKHFTPVDLTQVIAATKGQVVLSRNAFFLSFDDGLREFHDVIAPILLQKGVPATCFLNSDFIDNRDLFFRYKVALAAHAITTSPNLLKKPDVQNWFSSHFDSSTNVSSLLNLRYSKRHELDKLLPFLEIDINAYLAEKQPYLTSNQIFSLISQGFHFGAHSCDHPEYSQISSAEQVRQTVDSVQYITQAFQLPYRAFAFPFTDFGADDAVFQAMHGKNAQTDISFGCAGMKRDPWPHHFQRIPVEKEGLSAEKTIHSEYLYYLLKAPFGRNITRR